METGLHYSNPLSEVTVNTVIDRDADIRSRIQQHWEASESGDIDAEHAVYAADAILDYPQSGERFSGRSRIKAQRGGHPAERHFEAPSDPGRRPPLGERMRDHLRRRAHILDQHHGDHRRPRDARDPILRRPLPRSSRARRAGRADTRSRTIGARRYVPRLDPSNVSAGLPVQLA